jgi:uncharacterized protein (DUF362 family)
MTLVAITQDDDIESAIQEALGYLDVEPMVRGKMIAIKPNETWASEEDTTAITQPDTLRAVLQYIKKFEPRELIVTGGSGAGETDEIFRLSGLMDVVEEEGVIFFDHNRPPFQEVELMYAPDQDVDGPQKSIMVNPRVLEYETLIVVSQLKVHETATVTLALKNIAMSYPAADYYGHPRGSYLRPHHFFEDMHSFIAAMARRFPIQLAITVGHPAMVGTGPIGGFTAETGLVIASPDALAADIIGARLLGFNPQGVGHLWEAGRLGVGETQRSRMQFPALSVNEAVEIFTNKVYGKKISLDHP